MGIGIVLANLANDAAILWYYSTY